MYLFLLYVDRDDFKVLNDCLLIDLRFTLDVCFESVSKHAHDCYRYTTIITHEVVMIIKKTLL